MQTSFGHLSYCTNIHPGENWQDHFDEIKKAVPVIKNKLSPTLPFGIGLRLSNTACSELSQPGNLEKFKNWLNINNCYVFTMNGFPYGNFHQHPVKDNVYAPDWTTTDRINYTIKLFDILKELLPEGMEGSISTSPLSYRHWFANEKEKTEAIKKCTLNILEVVDHLIKIYNDSGKILHLNIEPEPDGLLENTFEFIEWYNTYFIPEGIKKIEKEKGSAAEKKEMLQRHLRLCFDVCHSALAYEQIKDVSVELQKNNISIGKVQISSALKINLKDHRNEKIKKLNQFNEPTYLHQVIAIDDQKKLYKFKDLPEAMDQLTNEKFVECRVHFHVPVFSENYDLLSSTQSTITETLEHHSKQKISDHWEVETYTWNILPDEFQLPINESIIRELEWVLDKMKFV
jgi:hypothetical protein